MQRFQSQAGLGAPLPGGSAWGSQRLSLRLPGPGGSFGAGGGRAEEAAPDPGSCRRDPLFCPDSARLLCEAAAVKIIQSGVRCFQTQQQLQSFAAMSRGARKWQGACARFLALTAILKEWVAHHKCQSAAAVRLQAAQRSFKARRELERRKAMRDGLLLLGPKEHQCVRLFQRCGRRYLACLVVLEAEKHRWRCAQRIQAHWRGQRCRLAMADTLSEWRRHRDLARCQVLWPVMCMREPHLHDSTLQAMIGSRCR